MVLRGLNLGGRSGELGSAPPSGPQRKFSSFPCRLNTVRLARRLTLFLPGYAPSVGLPFVSAV